MFCVLGDISGIYANIVMNDLRSRGINIPFPEVVRHIRDLAEEGRIYSTIDDSHFTSAERNFNNE